MTVADICAAAEIAPRTFFRYFPTKDDVLAEPARLMADRDWRPRLAVARAVAAVRSWLDDVVAGGEPDPRAHLDEVLAAR